MSKKRKHEKGTIPSVSGVSVVKNGGKGDIVVKSFEKETKSESTSEVFVKETAKRQKISTLPSDADPKTNPNLAKESENGPKTKKKKNRGKKRKGGKIVKDGQTNGLTGNQNLNNDTKKKNDNDTNIVKVGKKLKKEEKIKSEVIKGVEEKKKGGEGNDKKTETEGKKKRNRKKIKQGGELIPKVESGNPSQETLEIKNPLKNPIIKNTVITKEVMKQGITGAGSNWEKLQKVLKSGAPPKRRYVTTKVKTENGKLGSVQQSEKDKTEPSLPPEIAEIENAVKAAMPLRNDTSMTKVVALDCEFVGAGRNNRSVLAHVCMVNAHGNVIYEKHVRPLEKITDFRTHVSGVRSKDIHGPLAEDFWDVQKEVAEILKGKILVGHALKNDLKALMLSHPRRDIRDTQRFKPLKKGFGRIPGLRVLAKHILGLTIQEGHHSPAEDARASLYLYLHCRKEWERSLLHIHTETDKNSD